ncbi:MAG: hypothetical protein JO148_15355 [Acidimicrobiia bacterium]|nr:hypothetical protein [Acidimicrobiia bacterium]
MSEQQAQGQAPGQGGQGQRQARRRRGRRRTGSGGGRPNDLWRQTPALDDPQPIIPAKDPAAVLRSLGTPPLQGHGALVDYYLATVVERAAGVAAALAATAGVLGTLDEEEAEG